MKQLIYSFLFLFTFQIVLTACKEEDPQLGPAPTATEAEFTFEPSDESDNIIQFTNTSAAFLKKWDFGNGTKAEGETVSGIYPNKGTYTVTLTVYTSGGSVSSSQDIVIEQDDPTLLDIPIYNMLTGGASKPEGKTWILDATRAGHFGVGPNPSDAQLGDVPNYYAAGANEKAGSGLYNDEFTFKISGFSYVYETNGDVFFNNKYADVFPGSFENVGDRTAPYTAPSNLTWTITETDGNQFLNISTGGFIGYYSGVNTYKIVSISENELIIRATDARDPGLAWYQRLIPKDFTPPPPPPPLTSTLPIDFEGPKPPFNGFGGSTYDVVANPFPGGENTSAKVAKYVKGTEGFWAGIETTLGAKIDFSTNTAFQYKIYTTVPGKALFKVEDKDNASTFVEVFANITEVNKWQTVTFSFAGAASNTYNKIALFMDFDNNNGGTFYIDDIKQVAVSSELTLQALTGGSSKTWILKPAAGSFGVGPGKGSDAYYPNGQDLSGARPCLFDDEFIFETGGVYKYDSKGEIFGEKLYMGVAEDGCQPESNLTGNAAAWGSNTHTFTFTPATSTTPAYIAVKGTGAFIVLPKAFNGGEYNSPNPVADREVKYEVLSYSTNAGKETLALTLHIGGGTYWNYVLTNK